MNIKSSEFINFRNISEERIEFSPGVNVIYGENAQGKTNILEGIYIFARGKSFRSLKDKELISFGKSVAYSRLEFENEGGCTTLGVEISSNKPKHFYRNNIKVSKTSEIIGEFRSVLFCPSHLGIISDSPSVRRSFLDVAIAQLRPVYIKLLAKYQNYLLNRNSILKKEEGERDNCLIDTYSEVMAELCADISVIRQEYIKKLDLWVKEFFKDMTLGKETPEVLYDADHSLKEEYDREAIKKLSIDPALLPRVTKSAECIGKYRSASVFVSLGDNQASFLGAAGDNSLLVNIGTGSQISFVTDASALDRLSDSSSYELRP